MIVQLTTRKVAEAKFEIPDYKPAPEVLTWGDRVFIRAARRDSNGVTEYREALSIELKDEQLREEVEA